MSAQSPYRQLPVERRVSLIAHELKKSRQAREGYIMRLVGKGGGFRPQTLRKWPVEQLAKEVVRRNMETPEEQLGLLQLLYVELEPQLQIDFLDAAGVAHENGSMPEELEPPFAKDEAVKAAAEGLLAKHGESARHYLVTIATYNGEGWPGLAGMLGEG
jgi:hypothetical protein